MRNLKLEGKIVIFNSDNAGLFEGIFFWEGGELFSPPSPPPTPSFPLARIIFQEKLIQY